MLEWKNTWALNIERIEELGLRKQGGGYTIKTPHESLKLLKPLKIKHTNSIQAFKH